jgi:hypothetical protein
MTIPTKINFDCSTGEVTEIPLTTEEIDRMEQIRLENVAQVEAQEAETARITALKESAKAKLVAGQPLTEEEAATLVI